MANWMFHCVARLIVGHWCRTLLAIFSCLLIQHRAIVTAQSDVEFEVKPETFYENELLCRGEWKFPQNCTMFDCDYKASWEYRDENDEIVFTISTKNRNKWTGIGFSDNQAMPNTDAIVGLVEESGRYFLMDSFLEAYEAPTLDQQQNLHNMNAWRENGITTLKFSRPRQTNDSRDYQFTDGNCPYFIFPVAGGVFNAVNKRLRKHESTPVISDQRICIRSCRVPTITSTTSATASTTTATPASSITTTTISASDSFRDKISGDTKSSSSSPSNVPDDGTSKLYRIELKYLSLLNAQNKQVNSNAYQEMLASLEESLFIELKKEFDRVRRVEVNEIINEDKTGSGRNVLAIIDITVSPSANAEQDDTQPLTVALNSVIKDSLVGDSSVDSNYLVITRKGEKPKGWINISLGGFDKLSEEEQKWIIIGAGISSLVLLALIQLMCMFCGCCKKERKQDEFINEKEIPNKQWKEYTGDQYANAYSGYGVDEFGYPVGKSNSLHKSYRDHGEKQYYQNGEYYPSPNYHHNHHQSIDRRQHEHNGGRRSHGSHYEMNDRHQQDKFVSKSYLHQIQPDFYFMPHQRKYSSDVVRVFVDYEGN